MDSSASFGVSADWFFNSRTDPNTIPKKVPGLRLMITPSFIQSIELALSRKAASSSEDDDSHRCNKIPPPAHMNATFIKIGTWQRIPKYEGDLVAKILYFRRKLVWEYLEDGFKRKIECNWSSIQGLNADIQPGQPGILKIELSEAPSLHAELQLRPKKHTDWVQSQDFTGGQARSCRIHYLRFAPGKLDKPYLDMLTCEPKLQALSRNCFPTLPNLCFPQRDKYNFPEFQYFDHNAGHLSIPHNLEFGSYLPIHDPPQYVQHRAVSSFNNMRGQTMPIIVGYEFSGPGESSSNNYAFDSNNFHLGGYGNTQVMKQNRDIFRRIPTEATAMQSCQQTQNNPNYYGQNNGDLEHYTNLLQTGTHNCSILEQPPFERESPNSVLEQRALATNTPQTYSSLLNGNEANWKSDFEQDFARNISPPPRVMDVNLSQMQVPPGNTEAESHQRLEEDLDFKILDDNDIREIMALME